VSAVDARADRLMNDEQLIGRMFEAGAPLPETQPASASPDTN